LVCFAPKVAVWGWLAVARKRTFTYARIVGCVPSGMHHRNDSGLRFHCFYLERLCRRLCLCKSLRRVWARKMGRQEARLWRVGEADCTSWRLSSRRQKCRAASRQAERRI